jgi:hypothetical protein
MLFRERLSPLDIFAIDEPLEHAAKPLFDSLWQAGGVSSSLSYDAQGNFVRQRQSQS